MEPKKSQTDFDAYVANWRQANIAEDDLKNKSKHLRDKPHYFWAKLRNPCHIR